MSLLATLYPETYTPPAGVARLVVAPEPEPERRTWTLSQPRKPYPQRLRNIEKILAALESGNRRIVDVIDATGLHETTVHTILKSLRDEGRVRKEGMRWSKCR